MQQGGPPRAPPRGQPPPGAGGTRGHRVPAFQHKTWGLILMKDCEQDLDPEAKGGSPTTSTVFSVWNPDCASRQSPNLHFQGLCPPHSSSPDRVPYFHGQHSRRHSPFRSPSLKRASPHHEHNSCSPVPPRSPSPKRASPRHEHRSRSPAPPRSPLPKRVSPPLSRNKSPTKVNNGAPAPPRPIALSRNESPSTLNNEAPPRPSLALPKQASHATNTEAAPPPRPAAPSQCESPHCEQRSPSPARPRSPLPKRVSYYCEQRSPSPVPPHTPSPEQAHHHPEYPRRSPVSPRSPSPKRASPHRGRRSPSPGRSLSPCGHAPQKSTLSPEGPAPVCHQASEKAYPACPGSENLQALELLPGQRAEKMAAPMELYCWAGGWGLPSVDLDSLVVLTYARFTGAPLKVHKISNPWRSPSGTLPALRTSEGGVISQPHKIITHLRKQKYNADYDLSARQGADTLAFMSLLEEKLLPVLIHTFWVDAKNYVELTRKWYAEAMPFPLNLFLPGRMQKKHIERLQLLCGEQRPEDEEEVEKELYREARECLTLLSQRLGSQKFFFGDSPASLDAFVFSYVALLLQPKLPNGKLQTHVRGLNNLCAYCTHILSLYFPWDGAEAAPSRPAPSTSESDEEPYRRRGQILSVLAGLAAMVGYALLSGIVSIQRASPSRPSGTRALGIAEEEEDE
ncbi:metaxin-1 [Sarcophilus harrisii]|nr:metaxin-1 [Sarcophilus harrisii]